jgi:hypothetical protein
VNQPITSYTELMAGIQAQVGALGLTPTDFDDFAGFPAGLSGKVFGLLQRLGMFDAPRAAGLRLRLEIDPEQEAKMKTRISENYLPRQATQSRQGHASSLPSSAVLSRVLKPLGRIGGKQRWANKTQKERSEHMKMMVTSHSDLSRCRGSPQPRSGGGRRHRRRYRVTKLLNLSARYSLAP